jgi:predicted MFS family arabinose efflux permease
MTVPAAYALGCLTFAQLFAVSVVLATAKIAFTAASGANLKALVKPEDLLTANGRLASTTWSSVVVGPPLGGAAIGLFGPVTTMAADAVSYLLSACGIAAIRGHEPRLERAGGQRVRAGELLDTWRYILGRQALRRVFLNNLLVGGLILATEPLVAVLMLGQLGFAPWQYTLAFGAPCAGGLIGSQLTPRFAAWLGQRQVMVVFGTLCACWPLGLAFVPRGTAGLLLVIGVQFGLVFCLGVYNPVYATYRLEQVAKERLSRTLSAWSVSKNLTIAALIALFGVLASATSPRIAIFSAGALLLGTPALLPWRRDRAPRPTPQRSTQSSHIPASKTSVP